MIELYHNDMSTCAQKVRAQLAEKRLDWTSRPVDIRSGEQHSPEFLALNPKGVVPVLVHDGQVVSESNIIMEYLEDAFPEPSLRPGSAIARAGMRSWMQDLDSHLHLAIVPISAVAFRVQIQAMNPTPEAMEAFYASIPDPKTRAIRRELIEKGADSEPFRGAFAAWLAEIERAEVTLQTQAFLAADTPTLADFAILPYVVRLEQMQLSAMWAGKPAFVRWFAAMQATVGYRKGIGDWLNPKYLAVMQAEGAKIPVAALLDEQAATAA